MKKKISSRRRRSGPRRRKSPRRRKLRRLRGFGNTPPLEIPIPSHFMIQDPGYTISVGYGAIPDVIREYNDQYRYLHINPDGAVYNLRILRNIVLDEIKLMNKHSYQYEEKYKVFNEIVGNINKLIN